MMHGNNDNRTKDCGGTGVTVESETQGRITRDVGVAIVSLIFVRVIFALIHLFEAEINT